LDLRRHRAVGALPPHPLPFRIERRLDYDITAYAAISERTNMEFRRPQTLAKDGEPCRFMFFRKGTPIDPGLETH
jgi:hypothetical protein